ncbi:hypothetical protein FQN60_015512 [Etheostoma spectabile]|uniref:Vta1/callose synthase N-terminal domain-containing protein n=1 Tax=Etheostoma spectabile TaxID=54343 RepID=A0A5J5CQR9_9PERO|nr:hypothetical protein FQN60_015512 [Etheostoma spectabile]
MVARGVKRCLEEVNGSREQVEVFTEVRRRHSGGGGAVPTATLDSLYDQNMIKSFYSASLLLDVLSVFGELSEENIQHRKYARWKATYIHNYEYGGESSLGHGFSHTGSFRGGPSSGSFEDQDPSLGPGPAPGIGFTPGPGLDPTGRPTTNFNNIHIPPGAHAPANTPAELPPPTEAVKPVPLPRSVPTVDPALIHGQQQEALNP